MHFDIVFVADGRFEGGTSSALIVEIRAAARAGFRTGLLLVKGPILGYPAPLHPEIRALLDCGLTERIDPESRLSAGLVLIHHPNMLDNPFMPRPRITTGRTIVVLHHPAYDGNGRLQYDIAAVSEHCRAAFGDLPHLAPVSAIVRQSLAADLKPWMMPTEEDWSNLIDPDEWPARTDRPVEAKLIIGRHARAHIQKWPDTFGVARQVYPTDAERYEIRILGGGPFLEKQYGHLPENWKVKPFSHTGVAEFLRELDFYVYFHSSGWSEAFGRTILEALTVGLVTVLPEHFRPMFGDAALYAAPRDVRALLEAHAADPALYRAQSEKARAFVKAHFDVALYGDRVRRHLGDAPQPEASDIVLPPLPSRNILFMSSNGIGLGHVTRQLAIAGRLQSDLSPVFLTMSYGLRLLEEAGYPALHLAHHRMHGAANEDWNGILAEEVFDVFTHVRPRVFVYDATAVFRGVANALVLFPQMFSVWIRRPMWREEHRPFLAFTERFDAVIEPGELADSFDYGPTREERSRVLRVGPVLQITPSQRLNADEARAALGIEPGMRIVALQLGAGSNFDMLPVRERLLDLLLADEDVVVLEFRSPITVEAEEVQPRNERHRVTRLYPIFRYSTAFHAAVMAAGYNTFHENVLGGVPTLFVPNEADEMDLQFNRAHWAELNGLGLTLRRDFDLPIAGELVERLLDAGENEAIRRRAHALRWVNGADEIARYIEDHARLVRSDFHPAKPRP